MSSDHGLPALISEAQCVEERFLRQIFVRDQMAEWSKQPLLMARADGVHYWDVSGKRSLDALSGIYVVSVGHNHRRVVKESAPNADVGSRSGITSGEHHLAENGLFELRIKLERLDKGAHGGSLLLADA